jgi:hypothetical protein
MNNQKYNSVPEMVAEGIFRTQKYLKSMKKVLRLMKRNRPVEEVRAALNEALGIVGGESNMDNINFILTYEQAKDICEHYGEDITQMEEFEICELVDRLIDDALFS